jgi:hypothetical protein
MSEALLKKSTLAVKEESSYGVDPTIAVGNVIRFESIDIGPKYDSIDVDEVRNTKDTQPKLRGQETDPATIGILLRGCATSGTAPEGDPLYTCAMGTKVASAASVVGVGSSTTSIVLASGHGAHYLVNQGILIPCPTLVTGAVKTSGGTQTVNSIEMAAGDEANFAVGDIIGVATAASERSVTRITAINTTAHTMAVSPAMTHEAQDAATVTKLSLEGTRITVIATDTLTVSPAVSAAPVQYDPIRAGVHYMLTTAELPSFWAEYWRGDLRKEAYAGHKIDSMELDLTAGQKVVAKFSSMGLSMAKTAGACSLSPITFNAAEPLVAQSQVVKIDGTLVPCDKFTFRLTNKIYDRKDITTPGISKRIQMSREITGSFSVVYEDDTIYDAFMADTRCEALLVVGRLGLINGNCIILSVPLLKYTDVPMNLDDQIYKYDATWMGEASSTGEDSIGAVSFY